MRRFGWEGGALAAVIALLLAVFAGSMVIGPGAISTVIIVAGEGEQIGPAGTMAALAAIGAVGFVSFVILYCLFSMQSHSLIFAGIWCSV